MKAIRTLMLSNWANSWRALVTHLDVETYLHFSKHRVAKRGSGNKKVVSQIENATISAKNTGRYEDTLQVDLRLDPSPSSEL